VSFIILNFISTAKIVSALIMVHLVVSESLVDKVSSILWKQLRITTHPHSYILPD
jgi:hypothetical protein